MEANSKIPEIWNYISDPVCLVSSDLSIIDTNLIFDREIRLKPSNQSLGSDSIRVLFSNEDMVDIKRFLQELSPGRVYSVEGIKIVVDAENETIIDLHITGLSKDEDNKDIYLFIMRINSTERADICLSPCSEKLSILGMLAGGVCHDINNKLSIILGYSGLARKRAVGNERLEADLQAITDASHSATNLVQSLIKFSRSRNSKHISFKPDILTKEVILFAKAVLPSFIKVKENIDNHCGYIATDPVALNDLFILIISDALGVLQNGGELSIKMARKNADTDQNQEKISLIFSMIPTSDNFNHSVLDTRPISYTTINQLEKINNNLGSTMGVSIKNQDGGYELEFLFNKDSDNKQQKIVEGTINTEKAEKGNILLVEDEEMLARLQKRALGRAGYSVTIAQDGKKGYQEWISDKNSYDLILTDMTMPGMSGTELALKILNEDPSAKIILCTGYSDQLDEESALGTGIMEFLAKPVTNSNLLDSIHRCLHG